MAYHCYNLAGQYVGDILGTLPPQAVVRGYSGILYAYDWTIAGYRQIPPEKADAVAKAHVVQLDHDPKG